MYVHRAVIEEKLGYRLPTEEHVHHKNEKRDDNRLGNLKVVSIGEHSKEHPRLTPMAALTCPACGKPFEIPARSFRYRVKKNGQVFCSRKCNAQGHGLGTIIKSPYRYKRKPPVA